MSHECPDCGLTCYCGGDIGDCCFNRDDDVAQCDHCPEDRDDSDELFQMLEDRDKEN